MTPPCDARVNPESPRASDAPSLADLIREGQALRRAFDKQTATMRVITPDDLKMKMRYNR